MPELIKFPRDLDLSRFKGLRSTDPHFYKPGSVAVVLGSDVYSRILRPGSRRFPPSPLIARDTALGRIISGSAQSAFLKCGGASAETRQMGLGSLSTTHRRFSRDPRLADASSEFFRKKLSRRYRRIPPRKHHMVSVPEGASATPRFPR